MTRTWSLLAVVLVAGCLPCRVVEAGQQAPERDRADPSALGRQIERRFDVLLLQDGVLLRPRSPIVGVTAVEVGGAIAIDGAPVTGAELQQKLGADTDLVLQLSYLDSTARRALFSGRSRAPEASATEPDGSAAAADALAAESNRARQIEERIERAGRRADRRNARVRFGGPLAVDRGEVVEGDVVAFGGPIRVDGKVEGDVVGFGGPIRIDGQVEEDVVAIGGPVTLGPGAVVSKNVVVIGGSLTRESGARIDGEVKELGKFDFAHLSWPSGARNLLLGSFIGAGFSLVATCVRVLVLCLLAALVVLLGRGSVERVSARAAEAPIKSGAIGLLAQLLFMPLLVITILVLVLTIIGIPLLLLVPFLILGLMLVALVGFTAVGHQVGHLANLRFGWTRGPYATTMAGILIIVGPLLLARIVGLGGVVATPIAVVLVILGTIIEYLAWTVGLGAVALARLTKPSPAA